MESKGGKKNICSSSGKSLLYEAPLGYSIEDVRPNGEFEKFRSAAYSNVSSTVIWDLHISLQFSVVILFYDVAFMRKHVKFWLFTSVAVRAQAILIFSELV